MMEREKINVETLVNAPVGEVWERFTQPEHIKEWNSASSDWHTPRAENDLREGGRFVYRMEAKDGSEGFDFSGTYDEVVPLERYSYTMDDGRKADVSFSEDGGVTRVMVTFEAESQNPIDMQREGWQSILNNFKTYVES